MSDKTFVELKFSETVVRIFDNYIKEIVPDNQFYYSPVAEHIRGNMSKTLHCTVLFGLTEDAVSNKELKEVINNNPIEQLELGDLFFIQGYENLYKVLVVGILDKDGKLNKLYNVLEDFAFKQDSNFKVRDFKPHLTLAYVQNEYMLPINMPELVEMVDIAETKISLVSEFNKQASS
jgi:hypothetical protein